MLASDVADRNFGVWGAILANGVYEPQINATSALLGTRQFRVQAMRIAQRSEYRSLELSLLYLAKEVGTRD
jgi:hypothetical protein